MNACRPSAWWLLENEAHRVAADRKVTRTVKVGEVIVAATGVELVTKTTDDGVLIETADKIGRTWVRERAEAGHWLVVG